MESHLESGKSVGTALRLGESSMALVSDFLEVWASLVVVGAPVDLLLCKRAASAAADAFFDGLAAAAISFSLLRRLAARRSRIYSALDFPPGSDSLTSSFRLDISG